jgi:hypothetical protein
MKAYGLLHAQCPALEETEFSLSHQYWTEVMPIHNKPLLKHKLCLQRCLKNIHVHKQNIHGNGNICCDTEKIIFKTDITLLWQGTTELSGLRTRRCPNHRVSGIWTGEQVKHSCFIWMRQMTVANIWWLIQFKRKLLLSHSEVTVPDQHIGENCIDHGAFTILWLT